MITKTKSSNQISIGLKIMNLIFILTFSTTLIFAQANSGKKIIVQGSWTFQQDQFTGSKAPSSDSKSSFKNVKMIVSNNNDSIKSIKAQHVYRNSVDNKWYFEKGQVSSYNKWGEGKTESFDKLEVVASVFR